MRKFFAAAGMTAAAMALTAGAASASTSAEAESEFTHVHDNQIGDTKVNNGGLVNVSDVLNDADIANNLLQNASVANGVLAGGVQADVL